MVDADTAADEADMMDDDAYADEDEDLGGGGSRFSGKKIVLFVVLPLFILIGAGAALYVTGMLDKYLPGHVDEMAAEESSEGFTGVFYEVPDLIVNLNATGTQPRFLKISIQLELENEDDMATIETIMPRVIDHFQTYLRELRIEDLRGSAGIYRLRLELLSRVNVAARPVKVRDVLFQEILIQ